ncbi:unnamed protein product [marine sediment metagenome]|uniref:Uncharacterized protein n=1 Tax=marine sediment metagenome TaxID=412755 RepID=X1R4S2_9ZZZZ
MPNTWNMQLQTILTLLHKEARHAYWKDSTHCGSDFAPHAQCHDCKHFQICETMRDLDAGLANLEQMDEG